jgi:hypothetical protein
MWPVRHGTAFESAGPVVNAAISTGPAIPPRAEGGIRRDRAVYVLWQCDCRSGLWGVARLGTASTGRRFIAASVFRMTTLPDYFDQLRQQSILYFYNAEAMDG